MARKKLTDAELTDLLEALPDWQVVDGKLQRSYKFGSFAEAIGWMVSAGVEADKMDHHPEWSNVYNRVQVNLVTHDLGNAISNLDAELAHKMESLAKKWL